jgi:trk system potassium uptake protein TrkA
MAEQILIVGLGQFGMALAHNLTSRGAEVLAVDRRQSLVQEASFFVTESLVVDATSEKEMADLEPAKRDAAVCAIGDESRESAIICTALLRQMGCPLVVSRANDAVSRRILSMVGAHQVVNPEEEFGRRFASRLLYKDVVVDTSLGEDLNLTEIRVMPEMVGKNLIELALPKNFGIMVAGIRQNGHIISVDPSRPLLESDRLIIVSSDAALSKLNKKQS